VGYESAAYESAAHESAAPVRVEKESAMPARSRAARATAIAALALGLIAGATGCATTAPGLAAEGNGSSAIRVVAAENFWGSIAAQLGGSAAEVTSIIANPATDPHEYEPTAADARTMAGAQLAVLNGIGYDPWADSLLAASPSDNRIELEVGALLGLAPGQNPHQWYSEASVVRVIDAITTDYQKIDPARSGYFAARKALFETTALAPYHALISEIKADYAGTPIGASESIVTPLAQTLGLDLITPATFLDAISENNDPTTSDKTLIDRQIADHEIKVYVYNSQNVTPDVQAELAEVRARHIPVATVTETLSPAGDTFEAWMAGELTGLKAALAQAAGH
jgi:zinc/manganese transport system substrate-binding protein